MTIFSRVRRRTPHAAAAPSEDTVRVVDAPASLSLPFSNIPEEDTLIVDATRRAHRLTQTGSADEFVGHAYDTHYDQWHAETSHSAAFQAGERRRVDRTLIDEAHHRATALDHAASAAEKRADQTQHIGNTLWARHFPR